MMKRSSTQNQLGALTKPLIIPDNLSGDPVPNYKLLVAEEETACLA